MLTRFHSCSPVLRRESILNTSAVHRSPSSLPSQGLVSLYNPRFFKTRGRLYLTSSAIWGKMGDFAEEKDSSVGVSRKKLAVFVSGGGSNFKAIYKGCQEDSVNGDVVVLVTNKKDCGGADFARNNGIPVVLFPETKKEPGGLSSSELVDFLRDYGVDLIVLAGYLKLIPVVLVQAFPRRILNIHPSLLPAFGGKGYYGMKVHEAVIASGARYSGATIHFVDEHYDTGRILAQRQVPVLATDTVKELAARVLHEEHHLYVEAVAALCEERIKWREDGVPLIQRKDSPNEFY